MRCGEPAPAIGSWLLVYAGLYEEKTTGAAGSLPALNCLAARMWAVPFLTMGWTGTPARGKVDSRADGVMVLFSGQKSGS